jgi:hypothetical protein
MDIMGRWLALAVALATLAAIWASAFAMAPLAIAALAIIAPAMGLALAARFGGLDSEAGWPMRAPAWLRLRAEATPAKAAGRPAFVRVALAAGSDSAHAALAVGLAPHALAVDLDQVQLLAYAPAESPALATTLQARESAARAAFDGVGDGA